MILIVSSVADAATPLMPVEDLREGMVGYAKTVIKGDTIETFPVTVLGITGSEATGYQILVKAGGDVMERSGGISQGMSGSPVYFDGRLAGAVAFGKAYTDPHFCFLTPIHDMLALLDRPSPHYDGLLPRGTKLVAGGLTQPALEYLNKNIASLGLEADDVGASSIAREIRDLEPGSAVAVSVMDGDLRMGAIGTVTWMDDEGHVLAFGHQFMKRGFADYFLNKAWIFASIPNYETAYKVGAMGPVVGSITQDRSSGVAGELGKTPNTIPVFIAAADAAKSISRSARVRVVHDELVAPSLICAAAVSIANKAHDFAGGGTARIAFKIEARDSQGKQLLIDRENMIFTREKLYEAIPGELEEALQVLMQNKLEKVDVQSVNINMEMDEAPRLATIESVSAQQERVEPGEVLHLKVNLRPYRGQLVTKIIDYKIPAGTKDGKLELSVRGGAVMNWIQALQRAQRAEGTPNAKANESIPPNLKSYIEKINTADKNNEIIIDKAPQDKPSAEAETKEGTTSMEEALRAAKNFGALLEGTNLKQHFPMDFIVEGETQITVRVGK